MPHPEKPSFNESSSPASAPLESPVTGIKAPVPEEENSAEEVEPNAGGAGEPADQAKPAPGDENGADEGGPERITFRQGVREILVILALAAIVAVLIQSFVVKAFIVPSSSMSPTLQIGDRIMADRVTYLFRKPRRGDIVVWRYPPDDPAGQNTSNPVFWPFEQILETLHLAHRGTSPYVKRVVATEGETLEIKKGVMYIDGERIDEPYAVKDYSDFGPVQVPEGMFYGLGDNRPNSRDSRFFGPVPYRHIIGRVFLRWWPPSRFGRPANP